mmetsp:Transcript_18851/g.42420  ORF Transcript_18851/g.42420 Transcript_18851/m.42420 type:complete len:227 (+) Transcript_18851:165-845(+)
MRDGGEEDAQGQGGGGTQGVQEVHQGDDGRLKGNPEDSSKTIKTIKVGRRRATPGHEESATQVEEGEDGDAMQDGGEEQGEDVAGDAVQDCDEDARGRGGRGTTQGNRRAQRDEEGRLKGNPDDNSRTSKTTEARRRRATPDREEGAPHVEQEGQREDEGRLKGHAIANAETNEINNAMQANKVHEHIDEDGEDADATRNHQHRGSALAAEGQGGDATQTSEIGRA